MKLGDWLTLACLAAVIAAIVWGRRKGKAMQAAAIASARLEGYNDAKAQAAATAVNNVTVGSSAVDDEFLERVVLRLAERTSDGSAWAGGLLDRANLRELGRGRGLQRDGVGDVQGIARYDDDARGSSADVVAVRGLPGRITDVRSSPQAVRKSCDCCDETFTTFSDADVCGYCREAGHRHEHLG